MRNCRDVLEHLSEYLDEELPPGECDDIARHLATCSDCEDSKQRLLRSIEACHEFRADDHPRDLPPDIRNELKAAYERVRAAMNTSRT